MTLEQRNDAICAEYAKGKTLSQLASLYDLNRRHVGKIIRERGLPTAAVLKRQDRNKEERAIRNLAQAIGRWR